MIMTGNSECGVHSHTQKKQRPLWKEVDTVSDKEQLTMLIDIYTDLQRIKSAPDKDKEIEYQIKTVKAKLEAFGIVTEELDIH